ncbi:transporter substrate-binding domain-containing protein [Actinophytocola sp.]|uniref:transporter substrate-binding domain-containing protein n=1 Tax=Actinophytocola sp. TaxID=1872138 RepID=UPI002ED7FD24
MAWTRRQFLYRTTVLGAAATAGCSSRIGGTPTADPAARPSATESTSAAPRQVRLGIVAFRPYTVEDGGISGPVPDVARAVLEQLGAPDVKIVLVHEEAQLLAGLQAGSFDLVGGLAIRKDLCASVTFTDPDYVSGTALIVPAGNPRGVKTYAEVAATGAKLAVMEHLPEEQDAVAAGVPAGNIVRLRLPNNLLDAVRHGLADCAAFDDLSSRDLVQTSGAPLTVVEPFTPARRLPLVGAYAFPKDATDLLDSFNNRLRDLHNSGDWMAIVAPFGLTRHNAPPAGLTTEMACAGT